MLATRTMLNPVSGTTDPYFANVSLLLHMDGTNGSTTFTDSSSNGLTVTANGNAKISTAQIMSGFGQSGLFDGINSYLSTTASTPFQFGSSNFTIEGWIYPSSPSTYSAIAGCHTGTVSTSSWLVTFGSADTTKLRFGYNNAGTYSFVESSANALPNNTWTHFAIVRNGSVLTMYCNGTSVYSATFTATITSTTTPLTIGAIYGGSFFGKFNFDEFRIKNGVPVYTSSFTPSGPFPNS